MRKEMLKVGTMLLLAAGLSMSCSDNDEHETQQVRVLQNNGVFVLTSGNSETFAKGALSYYDYATQTASTLDSLITAGGVFLSRRTCDAVVYGSRLYVVVSPENTIYVRDVKSGRMLTSFSTTDLMGTSNGFAPRRITAAQGNVYVSTQAGYVAAIDTVGYQIVRTYQAGSFPEGISVTGSKLYVANSDDGRHQSPSISVIDLVTGTATTITHENIRHPQEVAAIGNAIYYLDLGTVDESGSRQSDNGVYRIEGDSIVKVVDATGMAVGNYTYKNETTVRIYTYNKPLGTDFAEYWYYDANTRETMYFTSIEDAEPAAIAVDPLSEEVFIAFNQVNRPSIWDPPVPDYTKGGFVNIYNVNGGTEKATFSCGIRPVVFAFYVGVKFVEV